MRQPRSGKPVIDPDGRLAEAACSGSLEAPTAVRCGEKRQGLKCAIPWGVLFPERVQDMLTTAVVEAVTVLKEELRPPKYGTQLNEDASRTFHTKFLEYERRVERANVGLSLIHI